MSKLFKTLYEDNSAIYARCVDNRRYHVIKFDDLVDACGENEAEEIGGKYSVSLVEIDLDLLTPQQIKSVQDFGDIDPEDVKSYDSCMVECASQYGLGAHLFDDLGNNRKKLLQACREESRELTSDNEKYEAAMTRPVNALGSTARELGQGDHMSAVTRGVRADDPEAKLVAKIEGATEQNINKVVGSIEPLSPVCPVKEYGRYTAGINDGMYGHPKQENTPGYLQGYRDGIARRIGEDRQSWK